MGDARDPDRASLLLRWWTPSPPEGVASTPLEHLHSLFFGLNAAVRAARSQQVDAVASLNADLLVLLRKASRARTAQALADVESEAIELMRRCAQSCCENWANAAIECNALLAGRVEDHGAKSDVEAEADVEEASSPTAIETPASRGMAR